MNETDLTYVTYPVLLPWPSDTIPFDMTDPLETFENRPVLELPPAPAPSRPTAAVLRR